MAKGCKFSVFHQVLIDAHILFSPKILPIRPNDPKGVKDKKMLLASSCQTRPGCKLSKELMYPVKMLLLCKIENEQKMQGFLCKSSHQGKEISKEAVLPMTSHSFAIIRGNHR